MQLYENPNYAYHAYWYARALERLAKCLAQTCLLVLKSNGRSAFISALECFESWTFDVDQQKLTKFFAGYIDAHLSELYHDEYFGPENKLDNPSRAHMLAAVCHAFYCNSRCDMFNALQKFATNN